MSDTTWCDPYFPRPSNADEFIARVDAALRTLAEVRAEQSAVCEQQAAAERALWGLGEKKSAAEAELRGLFGR